MTTPLEHSPATPGERAGETPARSLAMPEISEAQREAERIGIQGTVRF
jgi:hypothetical protein